VALEGVVYAIGGRGGEDGKPLRTCEKFDAADGRWSTDVPQLPPAPGTTNGGRFLIVAVEVNGAIYVLGGSEGEGSITDVVIFTGGDSPWVHGNSLPDSRIYHNAGAVFCAAEQSWFIVVVGGEIGGVGTDWSDRVDLFDQSAVEWFTKAALHVPRKDPAAAVAANTLYIAGGATVGYVMTEAVEVYDYPSNTWTLVAALATGVMQAAAGVVVSVGGAPMLVATGGLLKTNPPGKPVALVAEFVPNTTAWTAAPAMLTARTRHGVAVVGNGTRAGGPCRLFAVGGSRFGDTSGLHSAMASVEVFVV
jgi:hypothetical protein